MASTLPSNFLFISSLPNHFSCDAMQPNQLMKHHYINHEPLIQGKESEHIMYQYKINNCLCMDFRINLE
jgi:hypothetical protein